MGKHLIAEEVSEVTGPTFVAPCAEGGFMVYAWIGMAWRSYDWAATRPEAYRRCRKASHRLRGIGVVHDAQSEAVERERLEGHLGSNPKD